MDSGIFPPKPRCIMRGVTANLLKEEVFMKLTYAFVLGSALLGSAALANQFDVRPLISPENTVIQQAHDYIAENAEVGAKGGSVNSPCKRESVANGMRVVCTGKYKFLGPGGGQMFTQKFSCDSIFVLGVNGHWTIYGKPSCEDIK
jgi:hypothetical protein